MGLSTTNLKYSNIKALIYKTQVEKVTEAISREMSKIGEAMAKAGATPGANPTPEEQNPEVKDAEFKEKGSEGEVSK